MMKSVQIPALLLTGVLSLGLTGCGNSNLFSWAHQAGGSSDVQALSSDALTALQNKDYAKALEYYAKILGSDPNSSEAIYGYSAATLGQSGIDIASLVSSFIKQQNAPSVANLAPAIAHAANTISYGDNILPETIIAKRVQILAAVNEVLSDTKLKKILKGQGDGKIAYNDPDVNLNVAFCLILRAAITAYDASGVRLNNDYTVTVESTPDLSKATVIGKDIISAYHRLLIVAQKLNLASDAAISNIKKDASDLYQDLNTKTGIGLTLNTDYFLTESY